MLRALSLLWLSMLLLGQPAAQGVTVAISCGAVGAELRLCREGAEAWAERTGNRVEVISTPNSSSDRLALYQQLLAAGSAGVDVLQIDVIWPGILQNHLIDLQADVDAERLVGQFQAVVEANRVAGRLVALPWFVDAGLLYYRKDLLARYDQKVPGTWGELTRTARLIQAGERAAGRRLMWGFVWQGRAYEGLTCNALEWIDSFGGGMVVNDAGEVTVANRRAVEALRLAASWVDDITPIGVLNYDEEQARGVFQSGNAVFMRNWPYAWPLANSADSPVRGRVGVTVLPRGGKEGKHTGTLGGWQLAVSRYSQVKPEAIELVKYLTSRQEQKRRALAGGYNPTYRNLYAEPELLAALPLAEELHDTLSAAVARPSRVTGTRYNQVSAAFWSAVHATLAGSGSAEENLEWLQRTLERLSRGGEW